MLNLIIDRVGNVNIFNVLEGNTPGQESHLQSNMDEDLILEFVHEIESLVRVSNAVLSNSEKPILNTEILTELKTLGETFFDQFFPLSIMDRLRSTMDRYLHFNIDSSLSVIPWELLHDGNCFLSDKFYIGKTVRNSYTKTNSLNKDKMSMLIIADPTEDLEWAQKEGEELFRILSSRINKSRLDIQFIGGKQVSKLKLLSMIKGKNIIHYSGHLYFSEDPLENGWLLSDGKVLKAREIKNSGFSTDLVFSNSCSTNQATETKLSTNLLNYYAGSFLMSGIKTIIGTNWEIPDNSKTIDFTIRFYSYLFSDKTIGESLFLSKEYARRNYDANDLTWANYSLHGNPEFTILPELDRHSAVSKIVNPEQVMNFYPTPVAQSCEQFYSAQANHTGLNDQMVLLIQAYEALSKTTGAIIFSDHSYHTMGKYIPTHPDDSLPLDKWWDLVYGCLNDFHRLKISPVIDSALDVLHKNQEMIRKMNRWVELYHSHGILNEALDSYLITFQYFFENLVMELEELQKVKIFLIHEKTDRHYFFRGIKPSFSLLNAPMIKEDYVGEQTERYRGKVVFYSELKRKMIPFLCSLRPNSDRTEFVLSFPGFRSSLSSGTKPTFVPAQNGF